MAPFLVPTISGETSVNRGAIAYTIDVHMMSKMTSPSYGKDGVVKPMPTDTSYNVYTTFQCWCSGLVVSNGDTLSHDSSGSLPISYSGTIVVEDATVVTADLFAAS